VAGGEKRWIGALAGGWDVEEKCKSSLDGCTGPAVKGSDKRSLGDAPSEGAWGFWIWIEFDGLSITILNFATRTDQTGIP
jgi:hypothetical protein